MHTLVDLMERQTLKQDGSLESVKGTHAHSYVQSHQGFRDIGDRRLIMKSGGVCPDFVALVMSLTRSFMNSFLLDKTTQDL